MSQNFEVVKEVDENGNVYKVTIVPKDEGAKTKSSKKASDSVKDSKKD